jgi:hypothetical protein
MPLFKKPGEYLPLPTKPPPRQATAKLNEAQKQEEEQAEAAVSASRRD